MKLSICKLATNTAQRQEKILLRKIKIQNATKNIPPIGRGPGLVVMEGDSHFEGRAFESQCGILDGHFFTLICCKIVLMFD